MYLFNLKTLLRQYLLFLFLDILIFTLLLKCKHSFKIYFHYIVKSIEHIKLNIFNFYFLIMLSKVNKACDNTLYFV